MDDETRRRIAAEAVKKAEIAEVLRMRSWAVAVDQVNPNNLGVFFYPHLLNNGNTAEAVPIEEFLAELMVEHASWKSRAASHGCNVDTSDDDCG